MLRERLGRLGALDGRVQRGLRRALYRALLVLSLPSPLIAAPTPHEGGGLSDALSALRHVTWSEPGSEETLAISATRAEWLDDARVLSLQGDVSLVRRSSSEATRVTLRCEDATLTLSEASSSPDRPQLRAVELKGAVTISAPQLRLSAARVKWVAGRPLELTGAIKGRWRGHALEAARVQFWPDEGRVVVGEVRALIKLKPQRTRPLERARER